MLARPALGVFWAALASGVLLRHTQTGACLGRTSEELTLRALSGGAPGTNDAAAGAAQAFKARKLECEVGYGWM